MITTRLKAAQANGNSFLIADDLLFDTKNMIMTVRRLCKNVDGMLLIKKSKNGVRMRIFDKDGTKEKMCGNGLMIAAIYSISKNYIKGNGGFIQTDNGLKTFRFIENTLEVEIGSVENNGKVMIVAGLRHFVFTIDNEIYEDVKLSSTIARNLRLVLNANVSLTTKKKERIFARTFEIGVESFTKSCGTGCVAVAHKLKSTVVNTDGGSIKIRKRNKKYFIESELNAIKISN